MYKKLSLLICIPLVFSLYSCGMTDLNLPVKTKPQSASEESGQNNSSLSIGYIVPESNEEAVDLYDSINGNVIVKMFKGDAVTVYSLESDWAKVNYGGKDGYTLLKNISFSKPEPVNEVVKGTEPAEETEIVTEPATAQKQEQSIELNNNNEIKNEINLVFNVDRDGFKVADPIKSYPSYNAEPTSQEGYCNAWAVYIFSEPNKNSTKRETDMLYNGDPVKILGSVDNWYYISTDNGNNGELHGYVSKESITLGHIDVQKINYSATQGKVKDGMTAWVNYSPSKTDNKETLSGGHSFTIIGNANDYWYQISYNGGETGWISYKMVDVW